MDLVIAQIASHERQKARDHLDRLLLDWRKSLWPRPIDDPCYWEDRKVRVNYRMSKLHPALRATAEHYGSVHLIP